MTEKEPNAVAIHNLRQEVAALKAELDHLKKFVVKADPILASVLDMVRIYGTYKGYDNRSVPSVITNAFPRAGTVDIVLFDNLMSGGKHELTGIELGSGRNEIMPYYVEPEPAEATSDECIVAA